MRVAIIVPVVTLSLATGAALAQQSWMQVEQSTVHVDGVTIRRTWDTTNGVICYVAQAKDFNVRFGYETRIGLSCVKEKP